MRHVGILSLLALAACEYKPTPIEPFQEPVLDDAPGAISWSDVQASAYGTCALRNDGQIYCWGLRPGTAGTVDARPRATPTELRFVKMDAGGSMVCGITDAGALYCWGDAFGTTLGDGTTRSSLTPIAVPLARPAVATALGYQHACVLDDEGTAFCWGGPSSPVGSGTPGVYTAVNSPRAVNTTLKFKSITSGTTQTCAVALSNDGYCWGGGYGTLGIGVRDTSCGTSSSCHIAWAPELVDGGHQWKAISAGNAASCGLRTDDRAYCWGDVQLTPNTPRGLLGAGSFTGSKAPVAVTGGHLFESVETGGGQSCGILNSNKDLYCWGSGILGVMLPNNTPHTPSRVLGKLQFRKVSAGLVTCGLTMNNNLFCWGSRSLGVLGTGQVGFGVEVFPVRVSDPAP